MNVDELARLTVKLDTAAFIKAHRTPALLFLVPRTAEPQQETACSARALFFGRTNRFGPGGEQLDDGDDDGDDDETQAGVRVPRIYEIAGGSNVVFLESSIAGAFTLGRGSSNKLCLPVPTVSKAHALLEFLATVSFVSDDDEALALWDRHDEPGSSSGWRLRDLDSSNGTFVDERQLSRGGECVLDDGALIGIGPDVKLKFVVPRSLFRFCAAYREKTPVSTG